MYSGEFGRNTLPGRAALSLSIAPAVSIYNYSLAIMIVDIIVVLTFGLLSPFVDPMMKL
jgi:hypothetical protein